MPLAAGYYPEPSLLASWQAWQRGTAPEPTGIASPSDVPLMSLLEFRGRVVCGALGWRPYPIIGWEGEPDRFDYVPGVEHIVVGDGNAIGACARLIRLDPLTRGDNAMLLGYEPFAATMRPALPLLRDHVRAGLLITEVSRFLVAPWTTPRAAHRLRRRLARHVAASLEGADLAITLVSDADRRRLAAAGAASHVLGGHAFPARNAAEQRRWGDRHPCWALAIPLTPRGQLASALLARAAH